MKKLLAIYLFIFACGIICFGIAGYCYWTLQKMHETFAYYGASEDVYLSNKDIAATVFNLKFGIIKFIFLGVIAWVIGFIFLFKKKFLISK